MSVSVSLEELVAMPGTAVLWPAEFCALVRKLNDHPQDKAQWGVIADWCQENEEHALADAFRWVSRRPAVSVRQDPYRKGVYWAFDGLPPCLAMPAWPEGRDRSTLPGLVSGLVKLLRQVREEVATEPKGGGE